MMNRPSKKRLDEIRAYARNGEWTEDGTLFSVIDAQAKEIEELHAELSKHYDVPILQVMTDERDRYKTALEFYADVSNWVSNSGKHGITAMWTEDHEKINGPMCSPKYAGGKRAREALSDTAGEKE